MGGLTSISNVFAFFFLCCPLDLFSVGCVSCDEPPIYNESSVDSMSGAVGRYQSGPSERLSIGSHTSFSSSELQNVGAGFAVITSTHSSSTCFSVFNSTLRSSSSRSNSDSRSSYLTFSSNSLKSGGGRMRRCNYRKAGANILQFR